MIGISTPTYDLDGSQVFDEGGNSEFTDMTRRVSVTKTLDCKVSIFDGGSCAGDRTIEMRHMDPTAEHYAFCKRMVQGYREVVVCTKEGAFKAVPSALRVDDNILKLTLLIKEEI